MKEYLGMTFLYEDSQDKENKQPPFQRNRWLFKKALKATVTTLTKEDVTVDFNKFKFANNSIVNLFEVRNPSAK